MYDSSPPVYALAVYSGGFLFNYAQWDLQRMTGYTVHTGASKKFVSGWDRVFSGQPAENKADATKSGGSSAKKNKNAAAKKKKK